MILGVPVAFATGVSAVLAVLLASELPLVLIVQRIYNSLDSFPIMAVPLFILTGQLMNSGGITRKIINFGKIFVSRMPGGLSHVNVITSMVFAGISGSATADAAGIGAILIPSMIDEGYEEDWAIGITAASSAIGPIIPPSVLMIVYSAITQLSVGRLFLAGMFPGILIGIVLIVSGYILAKKRHRKKSDFHMTFPEMLTALKESWPTLFAPILIIGGITIGIFTATEAGAVAAAYALILGIIYGELTAKRLFETMLNTAKSTTVVLFLIACASTFGWALAHQNVPQDLIGLITSISANKTLILLMIIVLILIVGTLVDGMAIILVFAPVLFPLTSALGFDPYHFAAVFVVAVMIGGVTPPVGILLYIACSVGKVPIRRTMPLIWYFVGAMVLTLLLVAFIPALSTFLPYALIK
jgi:C4-dicarboxylate transporter DctM subunit